MSVHQKLKNDEEKKEVQARINRLNDMRGAPKAKEAASASSTSVAGSGGGGGGGAGLISTWKKLKGKKKKQRNLTAPEILTEDLKAAMTEESLSAVSSSTLQPVKEEDGAEKKGKGRFGKKSKDKSMSDILKRKSSTSPGEVVLRNELVESPSMSDDHALSQSNQTLSQLSDQLAPVDSEVGILPVDPKPKTTSDVIILEPLSLSQTSEKHSGLSLSQPDPFAGHDDHLSTQSSSDIPIGNTLIDANQTADSSSGIWGESRNTSREDGDIGTEGRPADQQRINKMYREYGSKEHKLNLERVFEFLKSSGETEPADLSVLLDWDGWMVASRDIRYSPLPLIHALSHEV